jgi:hypothetical protein
MYTVRVLGLLLLVHTFFLNENSFTKEACLA